MATKDGGCLFKIGYYLYTRTRIGYYYYQKDVTKAKEKYGDEGHTHITPFDYENLRIVPIPMALDNYAYLIQDTKNSKSVIIDPGQASVAQKILKQKDLEPDAILVTHKHWDHSGGNSELKQAFPRVPIYGSSTDSVPDITRRVNDGDKIQFGDLSFRVMSTPGHTVGHVVYILEGGVFGTEDCLFSGDCLFLGGCGRMFEAPPGVMLSSLNKIAGLKGSTMMWPGHEYAVDNLEFAHHLEPDNQRTLEKLEWAKKKREHSLCTCPSTIEEELSYNPFLRTSEESILRATGCVNEGEPIQASEAVRAKALLAIRERKDKFSYKL